MTPTPPTPRSTTYGSGTLFGAATGLLAVIALLIFLGTVVHEANAKEEAERVVPGSISVLGSAKARQWRGPTFELQVPAAWRLIATGKATLKNNQSKTVFVHRWEGLPSGSPADSPLPADGTCAPSSICLDLRIEPKTTKQTVRDYAAQQINAAALAARGGSKSAPDIRSVDLGPVTARGGRWVWRWNARVGDQDQTSYFFATCSNQRPKEFWEVRMVAPADSVPTEQFAAVLGSITTDFPSQQKQRDCSYVLD